MQNKAAIRATFNLVQNACRLLAGASCKNSTKAKIEIKLRTAVPSSATSATVKEADEAEKASPA